MLGLRGPRATSRFRKKFLEKYGLASDAVAQLLMLGGSIWELVCVELM